MRPQLSTLALLVGALVLPQSAGAVPGKTFAQRARQAVRSAVVRSAALLPRPMRARVVEKQTVLQNVDRLRHGSPLLAFEYRAAASRKAFEHRIGRRVFGYGLLGAGLWGMRFGLVVPSAIVAGVGAYVVKRAHDHAVHAGTLAVLEGAMRDPRLREQVGPEALHYLQRYGALAAPDAP